LVGSCIDIKRVAIEFPASLVAASYAAIVAPVGMYKKPHWTIARDWAVEELDEDIARQMDLWSHMSPRGRSSSPATGRHDCDGVIIELNIKIVTAVYVQRRMA
jgi:hypothetical protein